MQGISHAFSGLVHAHIDTLDGPLDGDMVLSLMQGIILALEALVAAGSQMVGTPQAGKMQVTRHEALRDDDTKEMEDKPAFERYLKGVRKEGASFNTSIPSGGWTAPIQAARRLL